MITADHGQVHFSEWIELGPVAPLVAAYSGDARFRYLHARAPRPPPLLQGDRGDVRRGGLGLLPGPADRRGLARAPSRLPGDYRTRIGDVALAAKDRVAFVDPTHPMETRLVAGHGSLTARGDARPPAGRPGRGLAGPPARSGPRHLGVGSAAFPVEVVMGAQGWCTTRRGPVNRSDADLPATASATVARSRAEPGA